MNKYARFVYTLLFLLAATSLAAGCFQKESQVNLPVPFVSQAAGGTWYEPWLNACEETSIYMVNAYYEEEDDISIEKARTEILEMFNIKTEAMGPSLDESMEMVRDLVNLLDLNWTATIQDNPTVNDLVNEISHKRPVIIPVYAPTLYDSLYAVAGPDYHVVVLIGYDTQTQEFIINDPADQTDKESRFDYDQLMDAIHDLDQQDYRAGLKRVLFTQSK